MSHKLNPTLNRGLEWHVGVRNWFHMYKSTIMFACLPTHLFSSIQIVYELNSFKVSDLSFIFLLAIIMT